MLNALIGVLAEPCTDTTGGTCPATDTDGGGGIIGSIASSAWEAVCKSFADAAVDLLKAFADAFATFPSINPQDAGIRSVYAISLGIAAVVACFLVLLQIAKTVITHDGAGIAQALVGLGKSVLAFLLTLTISAAAIEASNELTKYIIDKSFVDTDGLKKQIVTAFVAAAISGESGTLIMVLAVLAILCTLALWFELLLANAAIAVLVGTSPIAAAGQTASFTAGWWPKLVSATAQLIMLKPVIALVFSIGFSLMGHSQDIAGVMSGVLVLLLAVFAWPAIGKFFVFASVSLGGGAGVGAMLGFAAGRANAAAGVSAGAAVEDDGPGFAAATAQRAMATHAARTAGGGKLAGALAAGAGAVAGPAGAAAIKAAPAVLDAAQRSVNALAGRMGQTAGHAGLGGANPHPYPAGYPRYAPVPYPRASASSSGDGSGSAAGGPTGTEVRHPDPAASTTTSIDSPDTTPADTSAPGDADATGGAAATPAGPDSAHTLDASGRGGSGEGPEPLPATVPAAGPGVQDSAAEASTPAPAPGSETAASPPDTTAPTPASGAPGTTPPADASSGAPSPGSAPRTPGRGPASTSTPSSETPSSSDKPGPRGRTGEGNPS